MHWYDALIKCTDKMHQNKALLKCTDEILILKKEEQENQNPIWKGTNWKTKPCERREEQGNQTLYKKGRTRKQNLI